MTIKGEKIAKQIDSIDVRNPEMWRALISKASQLKAFLIGLVITIGSVGLILGAFTCAVASIAMIAFGVELVPSMLIGFFSVGVVSLIVGLSVLKLSIPKK